MPNGEDALGALGKPEFDVVLLDEMMPGMGGLETLDAIQARDPATPVILVTKSEEETLMNEAIGKRITDYLIKPVNPSQVFLACKRCSRASESRTRSAPRLRRRDAALADASTCGASTGRGWVELAVDVARWDVRFDTRRKPG